MPRFVLLHQHTPERCATAWAAWAGYHSELRGTEAGCTCLHGGHLAWWEVDAPDAEAALRMLPPYVAERAQALSMRRVLTP